MKNTIQQSQALRRGLRCSAIGLIAASLTLAAYGQGTSVPGPTTEGASTNPQAGERDTATTPRTDPTSPTTSGSATTNPSYTAGVTTANQDQNLSRSEKKFITKVGKSSPKEVALARLAVQRASDPQIKSYAQQIISDHQQMDQELIRIAQNNGIELEHEQALRSSASNASTGRSATTGTTGSTYGATGSPTTGVSSDSAEARMSGSATAGASATAGTTGSSAMVGATAANVPEEIRSDPQYRSLAEKSGREFDQEYMEVMVDSHKEDLEMFREQADNADDSEVRAFASRNVAVLEGHLDRAQTLNQSVAE